MESQNNSDQHQLMESFEDFFEKSLSGFIITNEKGIIIKGNEKVIQWTGYSNEELKNKRFSDLLSISGKIYYETHLSPLLRMQGFFDEVMLEIVHTSGTKMQVLVNALERGSGKDNAKFICFTLLKCSDRLQYEQNLKLAKIETDKELANQKANVLLREQLIAVLGHDLRNPLSSIMMAASMLKSSVAEDDKKLVSVINLSSLRMQELINNILDFARTRLGEGIILKKQNTLIRPVIEQVINELNLSGPGRKIILACDSNVSVYCDPNRLGQLLSNLVANALTHGEKGTPVTVTVHQDENLFGLTVINKGEPISAAMQQHLFEPFTKEGKRPSQQGLGLGLYICAEIARAHNATLTCISNPSETCFQFQMESKTVD